MLRPAKQVLRDNRERLDQLVDALMEHETLSRAEFLGLMDTGVVPVIEDDDKPGAAEAEAAAAYAQPAKNEAAPVSETENHEEA